MILLQATIPLWRSLVTRDTDMNSFSHNFNINLFLYVIQKQNLGTLPFSIRNMKRDIQSTSQSAGYE